MYSFNAGDGINATKLNSNFDELKNQANDNELDLQALSNAALLKNGSNLTADIIKDFNTLTPNVSSKSGTIALDDNTVNYITLTGNATISLPSISPDQKSHRIIAVVSVGSYSLNLGTTKHLLTPVSVSSSIPYQIMYIYNKIDNSWYYCLGQ